MIGLQARHFRKPLNRKNDRSINSEIEQALDTSVGGEDGADLAMALTNFMPGTLL